MALLAADAHSRLVYDPLDHRWYMYVQPPSVPYFPVQEFVLTSSLHTVEILGYGARFASGKETPDWTLTPYILQSILLLVAPALFAATIYMELGRIVTLIDGESRSLIRRKWMTKIFVLGDVLSFFLQGGGKYFSLFIPHWSL